MRRETAYKLAGRKHDHAHPGGSSLNKVRELRFAALPPGQVAQARDALRMLKGVRIEPGPNERTLVVQYSLLDYSLESLEAALQEAGFRLDHSLYPKLVRALVYFCEETQLHNVQSPERLIKKSNELYIKVYDHHLHGDHDDTPVELRDYR